MHGPTVHKVSLNLFAEGINLFCIEQKEGFKSVWPKHTSWISHRAVKLTSIEYIYFHMVEFRSKMLIPSYSYQNMLKVDLTWFVYQLLISLETTTHWRKKVTPVYGTDILLILFNLNSNKKVINTVMKGGKILNRTRNTSYHNTEQHCQLKQACQLSCIFGAVLIMIKGYSYDEKCLSKSEMNNILWKNLCP